MVSRIWGGGSSPPTNPPSKRPREQLWYRFQGRGQSDLIGTVPPAIGLGSSTTHQDSALPAPSVLIGHRCSRYSGSNARQRLNTVQQHRGANSMWALLPIRA